MADKDNQSVLAWGASVIADQAKKVGRAIKEDLTQGSGSAIGREAIKDVRGTLNQVFFGQAEGVGEPGAPLNPLQSEVAEQRKEGADSLYGKPIDPKRLPSPAEVAKEKRLYQNPPDRGIQQTAAVEPDGWRERIVRERQKANEGDADATGQNERGKVRSLPDEQREQDKSRGR